MATTNKKSSVRTKTTKKIIKKSKSAKTTKVSVAAKAAISKQSKNQVNVSEQLRTLNILGAFLSLSLAGVAGFFMGNVSYQLYLGLLSKNELASKVTTVFSPAIEHVYDLEMRWAVVVIMVLASILPILILSKLRNKYQTNLKNNVNLIRWIDMAIVGALMTEAVALLSGVQDLFVLKLIAGFVVLSALLGWLAEKQTAQTKKPQWSVYFVSLVAGLMPWVLIFAYAASTWIFGLVRSPWYVYALYAVGLLGFVAYALNQKLLFKKRFNFETAELNYLRINLYSRVAFAIILIIGLQK